MLGTARGALVDIPLPLHSLLGPCLLVLGPRGMPGLSVFLLHPCAVTFICLHATPTPLIPRSVAFFAVFSVAVFLDKPFSHSGINLGSSIATLSQGENKFAG